MFNSKMTEKKEYKTGDIFSRQTHLFHETAAILNNFHVLTILQAQLRQTIPNTSVCCQKITTSYTADQRVFTPQSSNIYTILDMNWMDNTAIMKYNLY